MSTYSDKLCLLKLQYEVRPIYILMSKSLIDNIKYLEHLYFNFKAVLNLIAETKRGSKECLNFPMKELDQIKQNIFFREVLTPVTFKKQLIILYL